MSEGFQGTVLPRVSFSAENIVSHEEFTKQNDSVYSGMKQKPQKCKGGYQRKRVANFSLEAEVWPRTLGTLHSPGLDGNDQDFISHDESTEAQADGEGEHCVQFVVLHRLNHIAGLEQR